MATRAGDQRFRSLPAGHYFSQHTYKNVAQMKQNSRMDELKFYEVQLLKDELCGTGSYGMVCKAMVDQLVCAAKIMHPTFFSELEPSSTATYRQFEKECDFLSAIRHPNIVQYLGTKQDSETGLPVLLMELMDESLTKFLERTLQQQREPVPYHILINLCHDVAMALAFLHSNGIVHRDLSSNNILLVGESRAKVTDFGMSALIECNPRMTPLTQCPGCLVYMAPEALRTPPIYSERLDVFSMGVCIIQMITCRFPKPTNAKRTVQDPTHGTIEVPIPERERRKNDIDSIEADNPLLGTALDCLADSEMNRPTAHDLCHRMIYYKSCDKYAESVDSIPALADVLRSLEENVEEKDRQVAHLHAELEKKDREMASLKEAHRKELVDTIDEKDLEIEKLKAEVEKIQKDCSDQLSINSIDTRSSWTSSTTTSTLLSNSKEIDIHAVRCLSEAIHYHCPFYLASMASS